MPLIKGTANNDFLFGTDQFDYIHGGACDDTFDCGTGNDKLAGEPHTFLAGYERTLCRMAPVHGTI